MDKNRSDFAFPWCRDMLHAAVANESSDSWGERFYPSNESPHNAERQHGTNCDKRQPAARTRHRDQLVKLLRRRHSLERLLSVDVFLSDQ
ncbi:MAG: hypothetical protein ACC645_26845, partial [Pirellulales bacterium]